MSARLSGRCLAGVALCMVLCASRAAGAAVFKCVPGPPQKPGASPTISIQVSNISSFWIGIHTTKTQAIQCNQYQVINPYSQDGYSTSVIGSCTPTANSKYCVVDKYGLEDCQPQCVVADVFWGAPKVFTFGVGKASTTTNGAVPVWCSQKLACDVPYGFEVISVDDYGSYEGKDGWGVGPEGRITCSVPCKPQPGPKPTPPSKSPPSPPPARPSFKSVADAVQGLQLGYLGQLIKLANSSELNKTLARPDLSVTILVPGINSYTLDTLSYLQTLPSKAEAAAAALRLIQYHVIPRNAPAAGFTLSDLTAGADVSTWLSADASLKLNTVRELTLRTIDAKTSTIQASGIEPGATFKLSATFVAGNARLYLLDSLLLPPSSLPSLVNPDVIGVVDWPIQLNPWAGLVLISKDKNSSYEGSSFISLVSSGDVELKAALSKPGAVYTIFVPTNKAISAYLKAKKTNPSKALLRHHILVGRALRLTYFVDDGDVGGSSTVAYGTFKGSSGPLAIVGSISGDYNGPLEYYETCVSTADGKEAPFKRVNIPRSDIIQGKSIIHYIDRVLDTVCP